MSRKAMRFLHLGSLRLGQPLSGLSEVPNHLAEAIYQAPLTAARNAFDAAVSNHVDFVVIAGDLFDMTNLSPRTVRVVLDQFQRLHDRKITVYWGGESEGGNWPEGLDLPDNVIRFSTSKPETKIFRIDDTPAAAIVSGGAGRTVRPGDYRSTQSAPHAIAIAAGAAKASDFVDSAIGYWALGEAESETTTCETPCTVHDPGRVQGRSPDDAGGRGATLVELTDHSSPRLQHQPTDAIRWVTEHVSAIGEDLDGLRQKLHQRCKDLAADNPQRHVFVSWKLKTDESLGGMLRQGDAAAELLAGMRTKFGDAKPAVWSVSLKAQPADRLPDEWYEEDTILGDFLRSLQKHQTKGKAIALDTMAPAGATRGQLSRLVRIDDAERSDLLRSVAALGVDLLSGPAAAGDTNEVEIKFKGGKKKDGGTGRMKIKHGDEGWESDSTQDAMMAMLDEQEAKS